MDQHPYNSSDRSDKPFDVTGSFEFFQQRFEHGGKDVASIQC